jgi:hypothetical protein
VTVRISLFPPYPLSSLNQSFLPNSQADIKISVSTISSDVSTLTNDVTSYTGASNQSLAIVSTFNSLDGSLKSATTDADDSYAFNEADSESIAHAITTLTPHVITLLVDLAGKVS